MLRFMEVLGGMFVLGGIAAPHMTTFQTHPQMYPCVSNLDAVLTNVGFGVGDLDLSR